MDETVGLGFDHHRRGVAAAAAAGASTTSFVSASDAATTSMSPSRHGHGPTTTTTTTTERRSDNRFESASVSSSRPPPPPQQQPPNDRPPLLPLPSFEPPPGLPPATMMVGCVSSLVPPLTTTTSTTTTHSLLPVPRVLAQLPSRHSQQPQQHQQQQQQQSSSVEKALAIAAKFQLQREASACADINDATIPSDADYALKRRAHFEKERRRLASFRLKNLEHVMRREEESLRRHVDCMNEVTAYEEGQRIRTERARMMKSKERKDKEDDATIMVGASNEGGGGIGSREQRRKRPRKDVGSSTRTTPRTSLYLTNVPVDGSATERTLRSLFGSYGRIDRVTLYRHRSTGELKGDGLVAFGRDAVEEHRSRSGGIGGNGGISDAADLVEAVCAQMNGAELPCGTVVGVQPADADYKRKRTKGADCSMEPMATDGARSNSGREEEDPRTATASAAVPGGSEIHTATNDDDEELDDFFASLA